jgi:hypothetical protein
LIRIGVGEELPLIPYELSQEGKDFLQKIFVSVEKMECRDAFETSFYL